MEDPQIILLNIRHYQELLKLDFHTPATRQRLIDLLSEAHAQLPFAQSAVYSRNR